MANRYATKTGYWSDVTVWDGGVSLPSASDTVRPNGFLVYIDQNVNVTALVNNASSPAVAGGSFYILDFGVPVQITAAITAYTVTVLYTTDSVAATIIGNVTGSNSNQSACGIEHYSSGLLTVQGIVAASSQSYSYGILKRTAGNITIVGDVKAGTTSYASAIYNNASGGTITITGNVTNQATSYTGNNPAIYLVQPCTLVITGNVTGNSGDGSYCIAGSSNGGSTITIIGNCTPGTGQLSQSIYFVHSADSVSITGTVYGSTNSYGAPGVDFQLGNLTVVGDCIGRASSAVYKSNQNGGNVLIKGNLFGGWGNTANGLTLYSNLTSLTVFGNCTGGTNDQASGLMCQSNPGTAVVYGDAIGINGGGDSNGSAAGICITGSASGTLILNGYAIGNDFGAGNGTYKGPGVYSFASNGANVKVYVKGVKNGPYGMSGVIGQVYFLSKHAPYYCTSSVGKSFKVRGNADRDFSLFGKSRRFKVGT